MPFIVLASLGAVLLHGQPDAGQDRHPGATRQAIRNPQTWIMSLLYIGTFGSFIGYSFALPLVIKNTFPEFLATTCSSPPTWPGWASRARCWVAGRPWAAAVGPDRRRARDAGVVPGDGRVHGHRDRRRQRAPFTWFFASYMVIFFLAGIGNGSAYRMIPAIFATLATRHVAEHGTADRRAAVVQAPDGGGDRGRGVGRGVRRLPDPGRLPPGEPPRVGPPGGGDGQGQQGHGAADEDDRHQPRPGAGRARQGAARPRQGGGAQAKVAIAHANAHWSIGALQVFLGAYVLFAAMTWVLLHAPGADDEPRRRSRRRGDLTLPGRQRRLT